MMNSPFANGGILRSAQNDGELAPGVKLQNSRQVLLAGRQKHVGVMRF
jgi:hypothetical protein